MVDNPLKDLFDMMIASMGYEAAYVIVMVSLNVLGFAYYRYLLRPIIDKYKNGVK